MRIEIREITFDKYEVTTHADTKEQYINSAVFVKYDVEINNELLTGTKQISSKNAEALFSILEADIYRSIAND